MAITMRGILLTAVPTLAALFGIFWFRRKKKEGLPSSDSPEREARADSVPKLILTQPSDEGLKVSEINVSENALGGIPEAAEDPAQEEVSQEREGEDATKGKEISTEDKREVVEDITAESAAVITCSLSGASEDSEPQNIRDSDVNLESISGMCVTSQVTPADCPENVVQSSTRQVLVSTDHVEETMEPASVATVSKPGVQVTERDREVETSGTCEVESCVKDSEKSVESNTGLIQTSEARSETRDVTENSIEEAQVAETDNTQDKEDIEMANVTIRGSARLLGDRKRKCSDSLSWEESPSPELAASPVGNCSASTNGSETSGDSGIVAALPTSSKTSYQFNFPADLCGLLIGSRGKNIRRVMDQSGAVIVVKDKVYDQAHQLIVIEGSKTAVAKGLEIIKSKFPKKKFPMIDWREAPPENPILCSEIMQLHLPDGVHVDVIVSSVVALNHVFVQQPTHPTFPMLENQNTTMNLCYGQDGVVPQLPRPIEMGVICAAPMYNGWYRAQVVQSFPDLDEVDLRFVDYGGYCREPGSALRQIRSDFTTLPFQAVECYLANVIPPKGEDCFPQEANAVLEQLVQGQVLQAEVVGQEDDGVPYIQLYILKNSRLFLVNRELVDRGVASWVESA